MRLLLSLKPSVLNIIYEFFLGSYREWVKNCERISFWDSTPKKAVSKVLRRTIRFSIMQSSVKALIACTVPGAIMEISPEFIFTACDDMWFVQHPFSTQTISK